MPTTTLAPEEDGWVRGSGISHANAVAANGSFGRDNRGNSAYVKAGPNYFCARTYYRFDTRVISSDITVTDAYVQIQLGRPRGGTMDAIEVLKLFSSSDISSSFGNALYETITTTSSAHPTDVGNVENSDHKLIIDGDLLIYLQTQIAGGDKSAFLLRNKGDYDVATEGNPSAVNIREIDGTNDTVDPFLSITYTEAAVTADNATFFGANF